MAEDMNRVIIVGRLTRDSELTYTPSGFAITKFDIATNKSRKQGEQWVEEPSFFNIVLWGKRGEALSNYLLKGQQVAIDGQLKQDRWEQDGQKRSRVIIEATNIQLLGDKRDSLNNNSSPSEKPPEDDIPF